MRQNHEYPIWYVTTAEYLDLLQQCMSQYGDGPMQKWHPQDLMDHLESIEFTLQAVFAMLMRQDRTENGTGVAGER